ncbi:MAG: 50S ribosomal protein L4, partial [Candidatus Omnitrophica bacterium]|nr:50S ribosomal protein L4 [Candidatus Omnitrophota bacterium]
MAKLTVHDIKGKETGSVQLPDDIFGVKVNEAVIHQA